MSMSIGNALSRFKTETKMLCENREIKARAEIITDSMEKADVESFSNPKLKKIALAYNKMDTAFWEDFLAKQEEGLNICDNESREGFINKSVYEYERMEAIYKSYGKIMKEPHKLNEYLRKLNVYLRQLEAQFEKQSQEQMRIDNL